ncbi:MAG: DUF2497 domain-containing protein [Ahrensia sp.]|nr:DUF2497 domain-containing protein [Ahrensia sp.]
MASISQDSAARQLDDDNQPAEPSMEDILASIRQIISDDDQNNDGPNARERYTHPEDHSNSNIPEVRQETASTEEVAQKQAETPKQEARPPFLARLAQNAQATVKERAAKVRADLASRHGFQKETVRAEPVETPLESQIGRTMDQAVDQPIKQSMDPSTRLKTEALATRLARRSVEQTRKNLPPVSRAFPVGERAAPPSPAATVDVPPIPRRPAQNEARAAANVQLPSLAPNTTSGNERLEKLAAELLQDRSPEIDAMLSDMMRPIIRKWLGDNLPTLVERLVREEIERVSRGKRAS